MTNPRAHLSDDALAADDLDADARAAAHVVTCQACRRRREELLRLRTVLAATGRHERRPLRDAVPSAMMRLRLRRHGITNANELLEGFAALMRGLAGLFSLPPPGRSRGRESAAEDDRHEY